MLADLKQRMGAYQADLRKMVELHLSTQGNLEAVRDAMDYCDGVLLCLEDVDLTEETGG